MYHRQDVSSLGMEERRVLTYWKNSSEIKRVIWKSEAYFFVYMMFLAFINIILMHSFDKHVVAHLFNISLGGFSPQAELFGLFAKIMVYFIFSILFVLYRLACFLKKNIERIASMDIEPWSADKPYEPAYLSFMNRPNHSEKSLTYIDEISRLDPKTPFTWSGFFKLIQIPMVLILSWIAVNILFGPALKHIIKLIKIHI